MALAGSTASATLRPMIRMSQSGLRMIVWSVGLNPPLLRLVVFRVRP
jgi:hypothetical protein